MKHLLVYKMPAVFSLLAFTSFHDVARPLHQPAAPAALRTIIIDAGHGGKDYSAHGHYSYEKNITLAIALKLGKKLAAQFPDLKILYTRTGDTYPTLKERADFANAHKGDLFISIHVNGAPPVKQSKFIGYKTETYYTGKGKKRKKHIRRVKKYRTTYVNNPSHGTETFIWAADRTQAKGEFVTERMSEAVKPSEYAPNINDPAFKAQSLLWTKRYFDKSLLLATLAEKEFTKTGRPSRGVKQRNETGIWVLQATAMPSILVETGFITYKPDEDYLNSVGGQQKLADCLVKAIQRYRQETEGTAVTPSKKSIPKKKTPVRRTATRKRSR